MITNLRNLFTDSYGLRPWTVIAAMVALILAVSVGYVVAVHHDERVCAAKGGHLEVVGYHPVIISTGKTTYVSTAPDYACLDAQRS